MTLRIGLLILAAFLFLGVPGLHRTPGPRTCRSTSNCRPWPRRPAMSRWASLPVLNTMPQFDPDARHRDLSGAVSAARRAQKSDAYFEGGYYLKLVDLVYGLVIAALLLWLQISARIRDWAQEQTHSRAYQVMLYVVGLCHRRDDRQPAAQHL